MNINIKRFDKKSHEKQSIHTFSVTKTNLLQALNEIKSKSDASLTFRCGCKSGVCGSCAVRVNGMETLACKTIIKDNDLVEPLKNRILIRDLVVDVSHETLLIKKANAFIQQNSEASISQKSSELKLVPFTNAVDLNQNRKYLKYALPPLILFIVLLLRYGNITTSNSNPLALWIVIIWIGL